jgi:predicted nucleic acid-binding protein
LICIDSSGWLEVFLAGPLGPRIRDYIASGAVIVVPTIVVYEIYKALRRELTEDDADKAALGLLDHLVVPLDDRLALEAADYSLQHKLSMADAVIYATARALDATLVTSDEHFEGLPGVAYLPKASDPKA